MSSTGTFIPSSSSPNDDEIDTSGEGTAGNSSENDDRGEVLFVVGCGVTF